MEEIKVFLGETSGKINQKTDHLCIKNRFALSGKAWVEITN